LISSENLVAKIWRESVRRECLYQEQ